MSKAEGGRVVPPLAVDMSSPRPHPLNLSPRNSPISNTNSLKFMPETNSDEELEEEFEFRITPVPPLNLPLKIQSSSGVQSIKPKKTPGRSRPNSTKLPSIKKELEELEEEEQYDYDYAECDQSKESLIEDTPYSLFTTRRSESKNWMELDMRILNSPTLDSQTNNAMRELSSPKLSRMESARMQILATSKDSNESDNNHQKFIKLMKKWNNLNHQQESSVNYKENFKAERLAAIKRNREVTVKDLLFPQLTGEEMVQRISVMEELLKDHLESLHLQQTNERQQLKTKVKKDPSSYLSNSATNTLHHSSGNFSLISNNNNNNNSNNGGADSNATIFEQFKRKMKFKITKGEEKETQQTPLSRSTPLKPPPFMVELNNAIMNASTSSSNNNNENNLSATQIVNAKQQSEPPNNALSPTAKRRNTTKERAAPKVNNIVRPREVEIPDHILFVECKKYLEKYKDPKVFPSGIHFIEVMRQSATLRAIYGDECDTLCQHLFERPNDATSIILDTNCKLRAASNDGGESQDGEASQSIPFLETWVNLRRRSLSTPDHTTTSINDHDSMCNSGGSDQEMSMQSSEDEEIRGAEIAYCSFPKLIQQLTSRWETNALLSSTVLYTYRNFIEPAQLLELLIFRFYSNGYPHSIFFSELPERSEIIMSKVLLLVARWIDDFFDVDFLNNRRVMCLLNCWIAEQPKFNHVISHHFDIVKKSISQHVLKDSKTIILKKEKPKKPPKPFIPKLTVNLKLTDVHPIEIARQLTIIEKSIFDKITPDECLRQGWAQEGRERKSPIYKLITRFNMISSWVSSEIIKVKNVNERAAILNRFIFIAEELRALSNYNAVMEIIAGLQSAPIYRLTKTWNLLPSKTWDIWENLNMIMSNEDNFSTYRNIIKNTVSPCIPYIGIYLTDLVFVDDGNLDYKEGSTDLINITKLRFSASILHNMSKCQKRKYNLVDIPAVQAYLYCPPYCSEEELKGLSLEREPRL